MVARGREVLVGPTLIRFQRLRAVVTLDGHEPPLAQRGVPWGRLLALVLVVVALTVAIRYGDIRSLSPERLRTWVQGFGVWGPLAYVAFWVVGAILMAPGTLLIVVGALAFPLYLAFPLAWIGLLGGTAATFWLGRALGRGWVERRLGPHIAKLEGQIEENGFRLILLMRLAGAPGNVLNYAAGLTKLRFTDCMLGTALGTIPFVTVVVTIANRVGSSPNIGQIIRDPVLYAAFAGVLLLLGLGRLLAPLASSKKSDAP